MKRILGLVLVCFIMSVLLGSAVGYAGSGAAIAGAAIFRSLDTPAGDQVAVPAIGGMNDTAWQAALNSTLQNRVLSFRNSTAGSSLQGDFAVTYYNGRLLAVQWTGLSHTPGAAHPQKIDAGIHLDLNTGRIYELADLFQPGVDYQARIKALCQGNEEKYRLTHPGQWNEWTYATFAESWSGEIFLLSPKAVRVYDSVNFATGYYGGYLIPYEDLIDMINIDGDLWKAINS